MTPLIREMVSLDPNVAADYTWFDVGSVVNEYSGDDTEQALIDTPYPLDKCAVVFRDFDGNKILLFLNHIEGNGNGVIGWCLRDKDYERLPTLCYVAIDGQIHVKKDNSTTDSQETIEATMAFVGFFLSKVAPKMQGYKATCNAKSFINRKRAAKKKPPLYDWHTVVIEPPAPKRAPLGGTHASPRRHERRGHWRTTRGKQVWVKNCFVGDASKGSVFKDYEVRS